MLHHTALHALGSFPLAAGTNCEREVDRRAGWVCMSDNGWAGKAKITPTPTLLLFLSVIDGFSNLDSTTMAGGSIIFGPASQSHLGAAT